MITPVGILSAVLFYLFPSLVGRGIMRFVYKRPLSYPLVSYFVVGSVTFYALLLLTHYIFGFILKDIPFLASFYAVLIVLALVSIPLNSIGGKTDLTIKRYLRPLTLSGLLALVIYGLWQFKSPYPFNWDINEHQTLINTILQGKFSYITSHISDTFIFNGYSSLFHTLAAMAQLPFAVSVYDFWHSISLIHLALCIMASYLFGKVVSGKTTIALVMAFLGAFMFDSTSSFSSLFLIPQTLSALIFIFLFIQLLSEVQQHRLPPLPLVIIGSIFLIVTHYIIGTVAIILYVGSYLYFRNHEWIITHIDRKLVVEEAVFFGFAAIIFSSTVHFGFLNSGEGASFTQTLVDKFFIMKQVYGYLLLLFLPLGVVHIVKRNREIELLVLVIMMGTITVVLLQLPYVLKFYVLARVFVHFVVAFGIYSILRHVENRTFSVLSYAALVAVLASIFITNSMYWKSYLQYNTILTHISPAELEAANFLKKTYSGDDVLLVSDPGTQYILEPHSQVNTQGGAYMNVKTRDELHAISKTQNAAEIAQRIYSIHDAIGPQNAKRLLAVSGRYFVWQNASKTDKENLSFNIWYPVDLTYENRSYLLSVFTDTNHFKPVFDNPSMVIFEVYK